MNKENKIALLLSVFLAALICANLLGVKIINFFGLAVSVGIFMYPLTFLMTNIVEEVEGKNTSRIFIRAGALSLIIVFLYAWISTSLAPHAQYTYASAYELIFRGSCRMIIASLAAFWLSQRHNIWAFNFWKQKTNEKYWWLRNNAAAIVSQLINTAVFMFLAFYQVSASYDAWSIIKSIIPYWLLSGLCTIIGTPIFYWGAKWLGTGNKTKNQ